MDRTIADGSFLPLVRPEMVRLHDWWQALRGDGEAPPREQIDPVAFRYALSGCQLVEVCLEPVALRYRLVGSREVEARGNDPTGRAVGAGFFGDSYARVEHNYLTAARTLQPLCDFEEVATRGLLVQDVSLFLPFVSGDANRRYVLAYSYQEPMGAAAGQELMFGEPWPLKRRSPGEGSGSS